jgi:ParB family transcriptional regulator, chromosome partitioning protein
MIQTIPLNKLRPSPRNVRRQTDALADAQLKADIEARGLLQNLVVCPLPKPKGAYAVEAGGRRLAALQTLAQDGTLPKDFAVPCLVLEGSGPEAVEAGLAENFQRLAMNPADECLAFSRLIEQGATVDGVAARFGLSVRFVEGRLRLANLAPVVFDALGKGEISLDIAKAYAVTPDRERQTLVFEQIGRSYGSPHPDSIRRMMTQSTVSAADARARFVGEQAYLDAGGRIERDLFADEASTRWLDIAVLERLATEKLETAAAEVRAESGLAWVRPTLDDFVRWDLTEDLVQVAAAAPPLTDQERVELERLETRAAECEAALEEENVPDDEREQAEAELEIIERQILSISEKPPVLDDADKERAGAFLVLGRDGVPRLCPTFYAERTAPEPSDDNSTNGSSPERSGVDRPATLSQRLLDELAMQRRDVLAVHVAADPDFALDLAIFIMAIQQMGYCPERVGSSLRAARPQDPVSGFKTPEAPATIEHDRLLAGLDRGWLEQPSLAARFDAFRALEAQTRAAWLGVLVAGTLEASLGSAGAHACAFHDHLGRLLDIDVAAWWRPTAALYFDRVTKPIMFEALGSVGGPPLASRYLSAKKAELAATCEKIFGGDHILDAEVKQAALAWTPDLMRFGSEPDVSAADEATDIIADSLADSGSHESADPEINERAAA